jgi:hypothetical protein
MVYVMMRETKNPDDPEEVHIDPVAVFTDLETAEGNSEGYNLSMKEQGVEFINFYVRTTMMYE